jgi:hypothetical protein
MNSEDKFLAIRFIRPGAEFTLRNTNLEWLDETQSRPTDDEIEQGWISYQNKIKENAKNEKLKREALLEKLGITEEEAKLLLGGN